MKKTVLLYGLISGLIITTFMVITTIWLHQNADFEGSMVLGYASMLASFSFIYIGIKKFRDKQSNGVISFGKAFKIGLYIALIASTMYVAVWLVEYYLFIPDFIDKYTAHVLKEAATKLSPSEVEQKAAEMANFKEMYKNPAFVVLITYAEILPIALIISLISALIVKRKEKNNNTESSLA